MIFTNVPFTDKLLFTKNLAVMLKSGIPIAEALENIKDQTNNQYFKKILTKITNDIANGVTLTDSLAKFPNTFDSIYINLIRVGEESGNLDQNLKYLAEQLKKEKELKQKIVAASLYPTIVFTTAMALGIGIAVFVLPPLIELFKSIEVKLPLSTKVLMWVTWQLQHNGVYLAGGLTTSFILAKLLLRVKSIRYYQEKLILSLPVVGTFVQQIELALIFRNVAMMLKSGFTIISALELQKGSTKNLVYKQYLEYLKESITKGKSVAQSIKDGKLTFIPKMSQKMLSVGEKTGNLDESFSYLADYFEEEVDNIAKNLANVLEPIMLIFVGLIVAFISFAIISPIYQFTGSITK